MVEKEDIGLLEVLTNFASLMRALADASTALEKSGQRKDQVTVDRLKAQVDAILDSRDFEQAMMELKIRHPDVFTRLRDGILDRVAAHEQNNALQN